MGLRILHYTILLFRFQIQKLRQELAAAQLKIVSLSSSLNTNVISTLPSTFHLLYALISANELVVSLFSLVSAIMKSQLRNYVHGSS